jgi:DNA replication and repair protein RecF
LFVSRLELTNFRNYREVVLNLRPGNLVFVGDNAQGKSNLLEAVYFLATARSVRASSDSEMIGWAGESDLQPVARVVATAERRAGSVQLEGIIAGSGPAIGARAGKRLRVNGIPRRAVDLVGQLRAVLFTADDLSIISGGPAERRRFLDSMLTQADRQYYGALQRYGRVLQQRNAVLRRIREGQAGNDELHFWDQSLAQEGAVILTRRFAACDRISELAARSHQRLSGGAGEDLSVRYQPRLGEAWDGLLHEDGEAMPSVSQVQALFSAALVAGRRRDVAAGVSLTGPHRDDLLVQINGVSAGSFGSRAQIRTATLALRLAEARLLQEDVLDPPVLLLDDIVSELDERRRRSVIEGIREFEQVWFTATDASAFGPDLIAGAATYTVGGGSIRPAFPASSA